MLPTISICIPAYKRTAYLKRLLNSIAIQTFNDFEVIITDDSPDDSVKELCTEYGKKFLLYYYKNVPSLGTPANWNRGLSLAKGEWVKLIHDDDWFAHDESLELFAQAARHQKKFIFSAYSNIHEDGLENEQKFFPARAKSSIIKNPLLLLAENVIGPPSVTLIHRSITEQYDTDMKWRVDIDFYIRMILSENDFYFVDAPLINVGISKSQVTNSCINRPQVELPEGLLLLKKYGISRLKNIRVYDAWWRIFRNVQIRNRTQLTKYTPEHEWPQAALNMIDHQSKISAGVLKIGVFSKLFMFFSYLLNYHNLKASTN